MPNIYHRAPSWFWLSMPQATRINREKNFIRQNQVHPHDSSTTSTALSLSSLWMGIIPRRHIIDTEALFLRFHFSHNRFHFVQLIWCRFIWTRSNPIPHPTSVFLGVIWHGSVFAINQTMHALCRVVARILCVPFFFSFLFFSLFFFFGGGGGLGGGAGAN